jgi:SAM-dependent methyltransferase
MKAPAPQTAPDREAIPLRYACPRCRAAIAVRADGERITCASCNAVYPVLDGIVSFLPAAPTDGWQAFFESRSVAADRDTTAANDCRTPIHHGYLVESFRRLCGTLPADARILDAGCGNGIFHAALFGDRPVMAIDYALGMCRLARQRGLEVCHADAKALPFADAQFDLIYSSEILQCAEAVPPILAEFSRVCRPHGRIVVSTLNKASLLRRIMRGVRKLLPHPVVPTHGTVTLRTAAEVIDAARGTPLAVRSVLWIHFPVPWTAITRTERYALAPLATNMVVEFVKLDA